MRLYGNGNKNGFSGCDIGRLPDTPRRTWRKKIGISCNKNKDICVYEKYARMMLDLSDQIGKKVDLVEDGTLLPFAERTANQDKK